MRRIITVVFGKKLLLIFHRIYHASIRTFGHFYPGEDVDTLLALKAIVRRSGAIIDIGANVGRFSFFFAQHRKLCAPIYSFEPNPETFLLSRFNLSSLPALQLFPIALGQNDGLARLIVPRDTMGNAVSGLGWINPRGGEGISVQVRRLDGLLEEGVIAPCFPVLVKIDVEGFEPAVLAGASAMIGRFRPAIYFECQRIYLERAGFAGDAVFSQLHHHDYIIFSVQRGKFMVSAAPDDGIINYLAVPAPATRPGVGTVVEADVVADWACHTF